LSSGRTLSTSNPISSSTSLSTLSAVASNSNSVIGLQDEDAASDISDGSDRKQDTEGEETDTAPEAEAVNNEDQFGDYVTRCIWYVLELLIRLFVNFVSAVVSYTTTVT
jgi:hypothetical protein